MRVKIITYGGETKKERSFSDAVTCLLVCGSFQDIGSVTFIVNMKQAKHTPAKWKHLA